RQPSTTRYLVAGIQELSIDHRARLVLVVEPGAIRDDRIAVIRNRVRHGCGSEDVLTHVVGVLRARRALERTTGNGVSLGRVAELGARLGDQRIIREEA